MAELVYTVKEAAQALGLSESAVYWMVYRNAIPHRRVTARGKKGQSKILIPKEPLMKWLEGDDSVLPARPIISTAPGKPGRKKLQAVK